MAMPARVCVPQWSKSRPAAVILGVGGVKMRGIPNPDRAAERPVDLHQPVAEGPCAAYVSQLLGVSLTIRRDA